MRHGTMPTRHDLTVFTRTLRGRACTGLAIVGTLIASGVAFGSAAPARADTSSGTTITADITSGSFQHDLGNGEVTIGAPVTVTGNVSITMADAEIRILPGDTLTIAGDGSTGPALDIAAGNTLTVTGPGMLTVQGHAGIDSRTSAAGGDGQDAVSVEAGGRLNVQDATFTGGDGGQAAITDGTDSSAGGIGGTGLNLDGVLTADSISTKGGSGGLGGSREDEETTGSPGGAGGTGVDNTATAGGTSVVVVRSSPTFQGGKGGTGGEQGGGHGGPGGIGGAGGTGVTNTDTGTELPTIGGTGGSGGSGDVGPDHNWYGNPGADALGTVSHPTATVTEDTGDATVVYDVYVLSAPSPVTEADVTGWLPAPPSRPDDPFLGLSTNEYATIADDTDRTVPTGTHLYAIWKSSSIRTPPPAPPQAVPFPDVFADTPFASDITWLHQQHITDGYPGNLYKPGADTTRAAAAAFLYRQAHPGAGDAPAPSSAPFADVPAGMLFAGDIAWLKTAGISNGWADGDFRPDSPISRAALAAFLYRDAHTGGHAAAPASAPLPDVPAGSAFAGDIGWAKTTGITHGYADGTFRPGNPVSREATAAFLHRYAENQ